MSSEVAPRPNQGSSLSIYGEADADRLTHDAEQAPNLAIMLAVWLVLGTLSLSSSLVKPDNAPGSARPLDVVVEDPSAGLTYRIGMNDGMPIWTLGRGESVALDGMSIPSVIAHFDLHLAASAWCAIGPRLDLITLHTPAMRKSVIDATAAEFLLPREIVIRLFTRMADVE